MFSLLSQNIPTPAINGLSKPFFALSSADFFFRINLFEKIFQEYVLAGLIWVKAVCKIYQQTTLKDKELTDWEFIASRPILCKNNVGDVTRYVTADQSTY